MVVGDNHNRLGITIKRKIFANYYLLITLFFAAEPLSPISTTPPSLPIVGEGYLVVLPKPKKIFTNYSLLITLFFAAEPLSPISTTPPDLPCRRGGVLWVVLPNAWQIIYYLLITL